MLSAAPAGDLPSKLILTYLFCQCLLRHRQYWSKLNTDGEIVWGPDPELTELGVTQAQTVNAAWKQQILAGAPVPQSLYSSPLRRAANTLKITWWEILPPDYEDSPIPVIKEKWREGYARNASVKITVSMEADHADWDNLS